MHHHRFGITLLGIGSLVLAGPINLNATDDVADLRGFGHVQASFTPSRARFHCADQIHADILHGKILADMLWNTPEESRNGIDVTTDLRVITIHPVPGRGVFVVGRYGTDVVALESGDTTNLLQAIASDPVLSNDHTAFKPTDQYPRYLDSNDLKPIKCYAGSFNTYPGDRLDSRWAFIKKSGIGGISFNLSGGMLMGKSPAPMILNMVDTDYEVAEAERQHGMIVPSYSVGGELPLWAANQTPGSMMRASPMSLDGFPHLRESYGMPLAEREATGLWSMRKAMHRYTSSPALGAWQFYDGSGGIEFGDYFERSTDFSPAGIASFRRFLRDVRKFDLAAVGRRYTGDASAFATWDQVLPMDSATLFGNLDETCLLLKSGAWLPAETRNEPPPDSDPRWQHIVFPPSQEMLSIPSADAFYRVSFDAQDWMSHHPGQAIYLVCGMISNYQPKKTVVWLNGHALGEQTLKTDGYKMQSAAVRVDHLLVRGTNELRMLVPKGRFLSPYFLTTHRPEHYPTSDPFLNARYVDLCDWQCQSLIDRHSDLFQIARGIDPDRPMIMAGGSEQCSGACADLARSYGLTIQNTGREAYYQPWWPRLGRVAGFLGSSEPSGNVGIDRIDRMFGHILIDGDTSVILFHQIGYYEHLEEKSQWFSNNSRLIELVGKSLPKSPEIVVLRSDLTMRYFQELGADPWLWDVGRGELNDVHYNWGYASEGIVQGGLPSSCKVLFDAGSSVMDQRTIDAIRQFVSAGGTFVALHQTGRHDPVTADAWPASQLTGCSVLPGNGSGSITFADQPQTFPQWAKKSYSGDGTAVGWSGIDSAKGVSIRLKPIDPAVEVIARWSDGSAAVTSRRLGKGSVVCLGSTFWRDTADTSGVWICKNPRLLSELLLTLGIAPTANATSNTIWLDEKITKNGAEHWLIAFNSGREPERATLRFRLPARPREVRDILRRTTVPFTYEDGMVLITDVGFSGFQTLAFSVDRLTPVDGLTYWWQDKITHSRLNAVSPPTPGPQHDPIALGALPLESWRFIADPHGTIDSGGNWMTPGYHDSEWGTIGTGPWNSLRSDLAEYHGVGLYRTAFDLPETWKGREIALNLYVGNGNPAILGTADFYVNGKKVEDRQFLDDCARTSGPYVISTNVDRLLIPGHNIVAIRVSGASEWCKGRFSGIGGAVYITASPPLSPVIRLAKGWALAQSDGTSTSVATPLTHATGSHLIVNTMVPADWTSGDPWLRVAVNSTWIKALLINGRVVQPPRFSRFGRHVELNLAGYVIPGEPCCIEIWGGTFADAEDPARIPASISLDLISADIGLLPHQPTP